MRPLESILLLRLWLIEGAVDALTNDPQPFSDPSAVLLRPWVVGESSDTGLAAVLPVRCTSTASTRKTSSPRTRPGDGTFWFDGALGNGGDVTSVSPVVDVERLLEDEGNRGAEKVLDAVDMYDSCEFGSSRL